MAQSEKPRFTQAQMAIILGNRFTISDLELTFDEELYLTEKARAKVLDTFMGNKSSRSRHGVTIPENIMFFMRVHGERRFQLVRAIQGQGGHFVHERPLRHKQLPTLRWILDVTDHQSLVIMREIELKFICLIVDDMISENLLLRRGDLRIWVLDPRAALHTPKRVNKRAKWKNPRKSRPQHGRPRSQVKSRNVPSGTSTGFSENSAPTGRASWPTARSTQRSTRTRHQSRQQG